MPLPFLDSMAPAQTPIRKSAASPRSRLVCIEMVHGAAGSTIEGARQHYWSPAKEGRDFDFSYCERHGRQNCRPTIQTD